MKKDEFISAIQEIGTCEDETQRRTLLANLQDNAVKDYETIEMLTAENEKFKGDNETLRKANLDLFLQVGKTSPEDVKKKDESGADGSESKELKYEDLFDEKGDLK